MMGVIRMMMKCQVFLMEETGVPGENHRPSASKLTKLSHIWPMPSPGTEPGSQWCEAELCKES